jgi:hypothetical protein
MRPTTPSTTRATRTANATAMSMARTTEHCGYSLLHEHHAVRPHLDHPVMPQNFLACDRDQALLMPPSLREWLPDDHFVWFVLAARDRARPPRGRRLPRDRLKPGARSRNDRALPPAPRSRARRPLRRGLGALRQGRDRKAQRARYRLDQAAR